MMENNFKTMNSRLSLMEKEKKNIKSCVIIREKKTKMVIHMKLLIMRLSLFWNLSWMYFPTWAHNNCIKQHNLHVYKIKSNLADENHKDKKKMIWHTLIYNQWRMKISNRF